MDLVQELEQLNLKQPFRLGGAESCTGGRVSAEIAKRAGVSKFFMGSIVAYDYEVKQNLLQVPKNDLQLYGAVSESVARAMAQGALRTLNVDWAFSITGIAGPTGGTLEKPVGTVWFGVVGPRFEETEKKVFSGGRIEIQAQACHHALNMLVEALKLR